MTSAAPLVLASTSPQRRAILDQLRVPFQVVAPAYEELPGGDPVEHAVGKARSVEALGRAVLGVDTVVVLDGEVIGKPADEADAQGMLERLSGRVHDVTSGLCLRGDGWEETGSTTTRVRFRRLDGGERSRYLASREWEGRAGGYAIQGLGAQLVEAVDGDYSNVVGLPVALLVRVLVARFPGQYF